MAAEEATDLRSRVRAAGSDHRPAGFRRGGLRETLDLCREGRTLVEFCAAELEAVGQGLEELRLDELVARLEGNRAPEAA